jgi:PAS domain S-box-containing protein
MKIATRRKKEKNLLQLMKRATDQSSDGIIITNAKYSEERAKILYTNAAFCKTTGYSYSELVGKSLSKLHGPKSDPQVLAERRLKLSKGNSFSGKLIKYRKDGSEYYNECDASPVFDSNGNITNYIYIMRDISEKVSVENKKDELFSVVSHEIKTPLTAINGFVDILRHHINENSANKNKMYLGIIKNEVDRLVSLTNEMLETTRIKMSGVVPNKQPSDLDEVIRQAIKNIKITADVHKINRRGKVGELINCDKDRIKQVVTNLLTNAVKYSSQDRDVYVRIKTENSNAIVSVQDFGIGIPPNKQQRVFERFYRATDKNQSVSTGLGLYISAEIIRSHGGKIWVESTEGKGSTFYFSLPFS